MFSGGVEWLIRKYVTLLWQPGAPPQREFCPGAGSCTTLCLWILIRAVTGAGQENLEGERQLQILSSVCKD